MRTHAEHQKAFSRGMAMSLPSSIIGRGLTKKIFVAGANVQQAYPMRLSGARRGFSESRLRRRQARDRDPER